MLTRRRSSNQSGQAIPFLRMPQKAQSGNMSLIGVFLAAILGYLSWLPFNLTPRFVDRRLFLVLRCFLWVVWELVVGRDSRCELAGSVVSGGSEVDEVFKSPSPFASWIIPFTDSIAWE